MAAVKIATLCRFCLTLFSFAGSMAFGQMYVTHDVMDKDTGLEAMFFKVPKGWNVSDSVTWNLQVPVNPMSYSIQAVSPTKNTWMSYLSGLSFDYAATGYGTPFGTLPPNKPSDFLIQRFQAIHPNTQFKLLDREDNPIDFPYRPSAPNVSTSAFHSTITAEFEADGITKQQQLSVTFYGYRQNLGPRAFHGNWIANDLTILTAPAGHLDEIRKIGSKVISSERLNPEFVKKYQEVSAMIQERIKRENAEQVRAEAQGALVSGGGLHSRVMDPDTFLVHESIKQLRSKIFTWGIGN